MCHHRLLVPVLHFGLVLVLFGLSLALWSRDSQLVVVAAPLPIAPFVLYVSREARLSARFCRDNLACDRVGNLTLGYLVVVDAYRCNATRASKTTSPAFLGLQFFGSCAQQSLSDCIVVLEAGSSVLDADDLVGIMESQNLYFGLAALAQVRIDYTVVGERQEYRTTVSSHATSGADGYDFELFFLPGDSTVTSLKRTWRLENILSTAVILVVGIAGLLARLIQLHRKATKADSEKQRLVQSMA